MDLCIFLVFYRRMGSQEIDISNYKCVPLDLLKNVSKDNKVSFSATADGIGLDTLNKQNTQSVANQGPVDKNVSGETIENVIVGITVTAFSIFALIFLFWGGLTIKDKGFIAFFTLPQDLRGMPAIGLVSTLTAILGFLLGYFIKT